jgi:hypothetical protein
VCIERCKHGSGGARRKRSNHCYLVGWLPYNIIRKVAPDAFGTKGVEDGKGVLASLVVHPVRFVVVPSRSQKASNGGSKRSREREKTL